MSLSPLCTTAENKENKEKRPRKNGRDCLVFASLADTGVGSIVLTYLGQFSFFACFWWLACAALRTLELLPTAFRTGCGAVGFVVVVIVGGHWGGMGLGCVFVSLVLGFFLLLYCINYLSICPFMLGTSVSERNHKPKLRGGKNFVRGWVGGEEKSVT